MGRIRVNQKNKNVVAFERLLKRLFNSIEKEDFEGCARELGKIVYYIFGRVYRGTLLSKDLVNQVYSALKQFIALYPDKPQPYLLLAVFLARQHEIKLALQVYSKIHYQFPNYKEAHYRHKLLVKSLKEKTHDQDISNMSILIKDKEIIERAVLQYIKNDQIFSGDIEFELWKNGNQGEHFRFNLTIENQGAHYRPGARYFVFKEKLQEAWVDRCSEAQGGSIRVLNSLINLVGLISLTSADVIALFKAVAGFRAIYSDGMKANLLLADLYSKLCFYDEACSIYQTLEKEHPATSDAYVRHEALLLRQGKYKEAQQIKELQVVSLNKSLALAEARNNQCSILVEELLTPVESRFNAKSQAAIHYNWRPEDNWQPEAPRYGEEGYACYQKIKDAFDKPAVKADNRLTKNNRPVSRVSSPLGMFSRSGHNGGLHRAPAPERQEKYVHPNGRPDAVRQRMASERYAGTFSDAKAANNNPEANNNAFKKMGY